MKLRPRTINIFSMSALDLFASAMGAFSVLMVILLPYYNRARITEDDLDLLRGQLTTAQASIDTLRSRNDALAAANADLLARNDAAQAALADARARARVAEQQRDELEGRIAGIEEDLRRAQKLAFLGIITNAKRLVIVADLSGSMKNHEEIMIRTMRDMIAPLDDKYELAIIGFQQLDGRAKLTYWRSSGTMTRMNDGARRDAQAWIGTLPGLFEGNTPTEHAMKQALSGFPDAEAIFLLTDGDPDPMVGTHDELVGRLTALNAGEREIHTVAVGAYREKRIFVDFLDNLARENGGQFIGISQ